MLSGEIELKIFWRRRFIAIKSGGNSIVFRLIKTSISSVHEIY